MIVIGIDPGTKESGYVVWDGSKILEKEIIKNEALLGDIRAYGYKLPESVYAVEGFQYFGKKFPVGSEVFKTCYFIGRIQEAAHCRVEIVYRKNIKLFLCGTVRAKDKDIRQALIDMLGKEVTKGVSSHIWSALAVAIYYYQNFTSAANLKREKSPKWLKGKRAREAYTEGFKNKMMGRIDCLRSIMEEKMSDEIIKTDVAEVPAKVEEPKQSQTKMVDFGPEIEKLLPSVGTIVLSEKEQEILFAPVDENLVEIRPDGLVYLSWMQYVLRLRNALGISWGLIPVGLPRVKGDLMVWPFWFLIRGTPVSFVIGEQLIANQYMTWAESAEGCRSNALMRACKSVGITLELWDPAFIRQWIKKFARQVPNPDKPGKTMWIRGTVPLGIPGSLPSDTPGPPGPITATEAVGKTMELFPGTDAAQVTPSATLFVKYHDDMVRLAHISLLRDYWTKNGEEAEKKLHPNHFKLLVELKNKLRADFIKKAQEKGGK